jgi:hypothetical protein
MQWPAEMYDNTVQIHLSPINAISFLPVKVYWGIHRKKICQAIEKVRYLTSSGSVIFKSLY